MSATAILKNTLPVEPPLWERNSWFVTSHQKSNFLGVILTFKGSLLSRALMLKRFPQQIGLVRKRVEILVFFGPETSKKWIWSLQTPKRLVYETEHVVWAIKRANRLKIAACRRDEETETKIYKKGRTKVTKVWYFTTVWRRPLWTDLNKIWRVCRSHQRNQLCWKWF